MRAQPLLRSALAVIVGVVCAAAAMIAWTAVAVGENTHAGAPEAQDRELREVASLRTRNSATFATAEGTYVTRSYGAPVHYRSNGAWRRIDNELTPAGEPGYALTNAHNSFDVTLPDSLDGKPVKVSDGDEWVQFALRDARDTGPSARGAKATYAAAFPGVDVTYEAQADGVKEEFVLADANARARFEFDVTSSDGLRPRENEAGGIDFLDRDGQPRLAFAPPFMVDAAGESSTDVEMSLRDNGAAYTVVVAPDRDWLNASDRRFPVRVDPTTQRIEPFDDCYLVGGAAANSHFCGYAWDWLDVGTDGVGQPRRAFQEYDVSVVPKDAEVVEGQLHIHVADGAQRELQLYRVGRDSTTGRTWNTSDGTAAWPPGGDIPAQPDGKNTAVGGTAGWYTIEARKLAQGWVDKSISNHGLILKDVGTNNVMHISASEQGALGPWLEVEWHPRTGIQDRWTFEDQRLSDRMLLKTNVANGNLILEESDIHVPGIAGHDVDFKRYYNSRELELRDSAEDLGRYWRMGTGYDVRFDFEGNNTTANFIGPSAFRAPYDKKADGSFETPTGMNADLKRNSDNTYTLKYRKSDQKFNFNTAGDRLMSQKDRNGNTISFTYGATGSKLSAIKDTHDQGTTNNTLTFTYNAAGYLWKITDRATPQRTWTYAYTGNLLTSYTNPDGKSTIYGYDASENLTDITDPRGNVTTMTYDSQRRVKTIRRWTDAAKTVGPLTQYSYPTTMDTVCSNEAQAVGQTTETDPNGNTIKYCWDRLQRVVKTIDGRGKTRSKKYTANSDVNEVTSAGAQAWKMGYDTSDRAKDATAPTASGQTSGLKQTFGYNAAITDKSDSRFWLQSSLTDSQGNQYDYDYDSEGNLTKVTNDLASQNQIVITPNADGTTASVQDAKGNVTSYGYTNGNLTSIDRPSALGDESLTYDPAHPHMVKTATDGRGKVATYTYDPIDRATTVAYSDGTSVTYGYDNNGNMTSRTDAVGQSTYIYDRLNRLSQETLPGGKVNIYTYDANGNVKTLQDAGGTTTYNYGPSNLLDSMQAPGDSAATTYTYNDDDQRKTTTYPNGVVMTATWEDGSTGNAGPGRLKRIRAVKGTTTISDFTYNYLKSGVDTGLRHSVTNKNNVTSTFTYDAINRLKTANSVNGSNYTYNLDGNGNITSRVAGGATQSYGYDNANELCWNIAGTQPDADCSPTPTGASTWTHDQSGELTNWSTAFSASYNAKQQATGMSHILGGAQTSLAHFGTNNFERASFGTTSFVNNALGVGAETTGTNTTYYRRDSSGGLASERLPSGAVHYYVFDGLGSVVALTDSAGTAQNTYTYDPYGGTNVTGTVPNPWRYTSAYHDSTGFYKMGMRYYSPAIGRWTQQDPKEQATDPRQANRYGYAGGDPINSTDPYGASTVSASCSGSLGPLGGVIGIAEENGDPDTTAFQFGAAYGLGGGCSAMAWTGGSTDYGSQSANLTACVGICVGVGSSGVGIGIGPEISLDLSVPTSF